MTDFTSLDKPDWIRRCKGSQLREITEAPYMLRQSDDPGSPWRAVQTRCEGMFVDSEAGAALRYISVKFDDGGERLIDESDDLEVGFIRPPWWPDEFDSCAGGSCGCR